MNSCNMKPAAGAAASCPFIVYLANLAVWNAKLHNLHWNVVGPAFVQVHEFTESLYDEVFEQYDAVAEACKMRGKFPMVRLADYLATASIKELEARDYPVAEVLAIVEADMREMRDLAAVIRSGADAQGDFLLVSQFEDYIARFDKNLWFLAAMQKRCCEKTQD